ncbi:hypothetical protein EJB05_49554 [Eragrostis curvula]|uniref:Reverse transcriptase zinc-binding domain-containing protein n=1 Tax=Eragrostis curvula TaxID=38414 RepID=A0A5J9T4P7_9POAL|nr:hypothetical protein EJB05_49554 [Eragrostis curvula]
MISNPEALWAKILKGKYFPNTSYWKASNHGAKSWTWDSILKVRDILIKAVQWQLFDGNISIWNQPWCPNWNSIHLYIKDEALDHVFPIKVNELWLNNPRRWNQSLLESIFCSDFVNQIMQVPLSQTDGPDLLIWKPNRKGVWSAQSAYKLIHSEEIEKRARNSHRFQKKDESVHSVIFQASAAQIAQYEAYEVGVSEISLEKWNA